MTMKRRQTKQIKIGSVGVGSDYPITVQSMTTTKTKDTEKTLEQVYELASNGADIVRVTCNEVDAATSLIKISTRSPVPIIADIVKPRPISVADNPILLKIRDVK